MKKRKHQRPARPLPIGAQLARQLKRIAADWAREQDAMLRPIRQVVSHQVRCRECGFSGQQFPALWGVRRRCRCSQCGSFNVAHNTGKDAVRMVGRTGTVLKRTIRHAACAGR